MARSTCPSQNVQNAPFSDHFWKLRCRKSAHRDGAKHTSKSKCTKHHMFAPLLEVQMSKKCRVLWREAHFQVKMRKTPHVRATFGSCDVEKVPHFEVKMLKTLGVGTTFGGSDVASLHYTTLHYLTLHSTTLHYTTLHYTTLHHITLHYTTLPSTTLHYITLHYTPLHYKYNYTTLHYTTLQLQIQLQLHN